MRMKALPQTFPTNTIGGTMLRTKVIFMLSLALLLAETNAFSSVAPKNTNVSPPLLDSGDSSSAFPEPSDAFVVSPVHHQTAIVVGGGPVGLATALTLSNPPHCMNVTVLEQTEGQAAVSEYDPTKAYLYNINPRGLAWLKGFPDAMQKLQTAGSEAAGGFGNLVIVPADPATPLPEPKAASVSGNITTFSEKRQSYWIPRHCMVDLLQECLEEQEMDRSQLVGLTDTIGAVAVLAGKEFASMTTDDDATGQVTVATKDGSQFTANLVVAADGIDSAVRNCLAAKPATATDTTTPASSSSSSSWLFGKRRSFGVKRYRSPATGLRIKSLQFPPDFTIPNADASLVQTESETLYSIKGLNTGPTNFVSLGLLPVKDPKMVRPTNIITRPNHDIWKLTTAAEVKAWFVAAFPRLQWDDLVDNVEWERFATAKGTSFPYCQHSKGVAVSSLNGNAGVVLVGDAAHAFPPDIGQGINAGLTDVVALDRALRGEDIANGNVTSTLPATLGEALDRYQRNRVPEHRALIRLARFGAPYQYNQSWRRDRLAKKLWTGNVVFRMALNKISRGLIPPVAILLAQDNMLTYRQVMRRADSTARIVKASMLASVAWFVAKRMAFL